MARRFTGSTNFSGTLWIDGGHLSSTTVPVSAFPFTMAGWAKVADATQFNPLAALSDDGNGNDACLVTVDSENLTVRFISSGMASIVTAAVADNEEFFWALVCESATVKRLYKNGVLAGTITTNLTFPSTFDKYYIAAEYRSLLLTAHDATIAIPAVWNVALTEAEIQRLAAGVFPAEIRTPVALHGLYRAASPEVDLIGTNDLTVNTPGTGTAATASGLTIQYGTPRFITQYKTGGDMADRTPIQTITGTVSSTALTLSTFGTGFSAANQAIAKGIMVSCITGDVMVSCSPSFTPTASNGHPVVADGPAFPIECSRGEGYASNFRVIRRTVDATVTISLYA